MVKPRVPLRRFYATNGAKDAHSRVGLHPWPSSAKPGPYELFQMEQSAQNASRLEFNKALKSTHSKYVKVYHPDVNHSIEILHSSGRKLTSDEKRARFDQVQTAYELLRDPKRRLAYNKYKDTAWEGYNAQTNPGTFNAFRYANAHRNKYDFNRDEAFWTAGTWEDYYRMRYQRAPPTQEEFDKNKYKILAGVLAVAAIAVTLQVMLAVERTNEFRRHERLLNLRSQQQLDQAHDNYGVGESKLQRLHRFLLQRRVQLGLSDEKKEEMRREDGRILTQYARKQVEKLPEETG